MNLRRCKAATVSAGAISAACQCKCQRSAGASQAADGVSCQSGMIPRWPPPPLSPRARAGVALGSAKGGRGLRAQSRRRTQQRLVVEEGGARLAVALIIRSKRAFSRCQLTPATEGVIGSVVGQRVSGEAHAERRGTQGFSVGWNRAHLPYRLAPACGSTAHRARKWFSLCTSPGEMEPGGRRHLVARHGKAAGLSHV